MTGRGDAPPAVPTYRSAREIAAMAPQNHPEFALLRWLAARVFA